MHAKKKAERRGKLAPLQDKPNSRADIIKKKLAYPNHKMKPLYLPAERAGRPERARVAIPGGRIGGCPLEEWVVLGLLYAG